MYYPTHHSTHYLLTLISNETTPTEIYTLSLHDALPISEEPDHLARELSGVRPIDHAVVERRAQAQDRSHLDALLDDPRPVANLGHEHEHRAARERRQRREGRVDPEHADVRDHGAAERVARHAERRQVEVQLVREEVHDPEQRPDEEPRQPAEEAAALLVCGVRLLADLPRALADLLTELDRGLLVG